MLDFWKEDLTPEDEDKLIEKIASKIESRRIVAPAILVLEMHKPLAYVGASASVALSPFIAPFTGFDVLNDYSRLLQTRANVERLIQRLEKGPVLAQAGAA